MDTLAAEYSEHGFDSLFIYTREAHPGEILPHHTSFAQKLAMARRFQEEQGVRRRILVDALDGAVVGSRPSGRSGWAIASSIRRPSTLGWSATVRRQ